MCTIGEQLKAKGQLLPKGFLAGSKKSPIPKGKKKERKNGKACTKVATPTEEDTINCFSVDSEGLTRGLQIQFGEIIAVYVGDSENGGREWYVPVDWHNGPDLAEDVGEGAKLLRADVGLVKDVKRPFKTIVKASSENNYVLVFIRTGRQNVLKSSFLQCVKSFAGNPSRVISGTVCSRYEAVASLEQLWRFKEGDVVMICFFDGSIKLLSCNKGQVTMRSANEYGEKLFGIVSRLEEIESLTKGKVKSRDRGYHTAIDAGIRTGFLQGALKILEEAAENHDLRTKVVEHLLKRGYGDKDSLRRIFKILCVNDKVYENIAKMSESTKKEEIDNAVKMRDGAYHHAIDVASTIGWWEGVARLFQEARKKRDLRAGVFNHFRDKCLDDNARALVGDSLREAPGLDGVDFLKGIPRRSVSLSKSKAKRAEKSVIDRELREKMKGESGSKSKIFSNSKKVAKKARKVVQKK